MRCSMRALPISSVRWPAPTRGCWSRRPPPAGARPWKSGGGPRRLLGGPRRERRRIRALLAAAHGAADGARQAVAAGVRGRDGAGGPVAPADRAAGRREHRLSLRGLRGMATLGGKTLFITG